MTHVEDIEGEAVQIVKVNDQDPEHSYILDEDALRFVASFRKKTCETVALN
jgi:hypothetical protein